MCERKREILRISFGRHTRHLNCFLPPFLSSLWKLSFSLSLSLVLYMIVYIQKKKAKSKVYIGFQGEASGSVSRGQSHVFYVTVKWSSLCATHLGRTWSDWTNLFSSFSFLLSLFTSTCPCSSSRPIHSLIDSWRGRPELLQCGRSASLCWRVWKLQSLIELLDWH